MMTGFGRGRRCWDIAGRDCDVGLLSPYVRQELAVCLCVRGDSSCIISKSVVPKPELIEFEGVLCGGICQGPLVPMTGDVIRCNPQATTNRRQFECHASSDLPWLIRNRQIPALAFSKSRGRSTLFIPCCRRACDRSQNESWRFTACWRSVTSGTG